MWIGVYNLSTKQVEWLNPYTIIKIYTVNGVTTLLVEGGRFGITIPIPDSPQMFMNRYSAIVTYLQVPGFNYVAIMKAVLDDQVIDRSILGITELTKWSTIQHEILSTPANSQVESFMKTYKLAFLDHARAQTMMDLLWVMGFFSSRIIYDDIALPPIPDPKLLPSIPPERPLSP